MTHIMDARGSVGGLSAAGTRALTVAALDTVPLFVEGLCGVIGRTPGLRWVGSASSHHAFLQLCDQLRPNIAVLDSGLDPHCHLTRILAEADSAMLMMVLVRDPQRTPVYLASAARAGAHAAVPRAAEPRRITEAIRRAYVDRRYVDPSLVSLTARPKRQSSSTGGHDPAERPRMPLTRREYQVLQLVAEGLENSAIAKVLYLSVETVRTHVKSILRKLSARDRTHAVTKAFRSGILVVAAEDIPVANGEPSGPGAPSVAR